MWVYVVYQDYVSNQTIAYGPNAFIDPQFSRSVSVISTREPISRPSFTRRTLSSKSGILIRWDRVTLTFLTTDHKLRLNRSGPEIAKRIFLNRLGSGPRITTHDDVGRYPLFPGIELPRSDFLKRRFRSLRVLRFDSFHFFEIVFYFLGRQPDRSNYRLRRLHESDVRRC